MSSSLEKNFIIRAQGWLKVENYDTYLINQMRSQDMVLAYMASLQIVPAVFKYLFTQRGAKV
jgi:hypothetical protein